MAQDLINLLRKNNILIKIGYQKDLFNTYCKYGPFSSEFFEQLQISTSSNFKQIVKNLINSLPPSQVSVINEEILELINDFSNYLFQNRYLKGEDIKKLVNDILNGIKNQQIISKYRLLDEFQKDFHFFLKKMENKIINLQGSQKEKLISEINSKILDRTQQKVGQKVITLNSDRAPTPQSFKTICLKNRIFIKQSFLQEFFRFIQKQEAQSINLQLLISKLTYPSFYQKLKQIVLILFKKDDSGQDSVLIKSQINSLRITHLQPIQRPSIFIDQCVSNLQIDIQDFESNGFSIPSRVQVQARSQQMIEQPNQQARRQSQNHLINPLKENQSIVYQNQKDINIILIYLAINPCKKIQIKQHNTQEWIQVNFTQKNYQNRVQIYFFNLIKKKHATFKVKINEKNNERNIDIDVNQLKIHKKIYRNCCLLIETSDDPRLKKERIDSLSLLNYSLFLGIKFLAKNVNYNEREDISLYFLKLFYENYSFQLPQQNSAALLRNLYISKSVPLFHTRYLIYFFYQIFKKKALKYFFDHQIFRDLKYTYDYQFKPPENFTIQTAVYFYNLTQLIYFLKMQPKQIETILNLCRENLQNQKKQNTYIILYIIVCQAPIEVILILQAQIKLKCLQNPFITQPQYYNLMTKFIQKVLNNKDDLQEKKNSIIIYLKDLIFFCGKKREFNSNRGLQINSKIFEAFVNGSISKNERINFSLKLKTIYKETNGQLDPTAKLRDTGNFQPENDQALYVMHLAKKPLTNFDQLEIKRLIKNRFWSQHLQSFLKTLASECKLANYKVQNITDIVSSILKKCNKLTAQRVDEIVLGWLDVCKTTHQKGQYKVEDIQFLTIVFRTLLFSVQFMIL